MIKPEKGILSGGVPITPIQKWFFNRKWENINHFNQAVLLAMSEDVTLHMIKAIFNVAVQYHDVFRMRYKFENGQYFQEYTDDFSVIVEEREISLEDLYQDATKVQGSLNISEGPLFRVVLYRCSDNVRRLLIVVHHLVIDGVSWRILIDDIETIYRAFMESGRIALPAKTYSYRQWGEALINYATSKEGENEKKYWLEVEKSIKSTFLPSDFDEYTDTAGFDCIEMSLSASETKHLIQNVPQKYGAQINDILLTALTLASGDMSGNYECSFSLEGHGRENVIGLDVSRTIGWFTSLFPVSLKVSNPQNLETCLKEVGNSLRQIPNKGIGYGIIKSYTDVLNGVFPKVGFNYLGQWDTSNSDTTVFSYAEESPGDAVDRRNICHNLIDMNCLVRKSVFKMGIAYHKGFYKRSTIEIFAHKFKERLLSAIRE